MARRGLSGATMRLNSDSSVSVVAVNRVALVAILSQRSEGTQPHLDFRGYVWAEELKAL